MIIIKKPDITIERLIEFCTKINTNEFAKNTFSLSWYRLSNRRIYFDSNNNNHWSNLTSLMTAPGKKMYDSDTIIIHCPTAFDAKQKPFKIGYKTAAHDINGDTEDHFCIYDDDVIASRWELNNILYEGDYDAMISENITNFEKLEEIRDTSACVLTVEGLFIPYPETYTEDNGILFNYMPKETPKEAKLVNMSSIIAHQFDDYDGVGKSGDIVLPKYNGRFLNQLKDCTCYAYKSRRGTNMSIYAKEKKMTITLTMEEFKANFYYKHLVN